MERAEILTSGFLVLGGTRHQKGCESRGQTGTECQDERHSEDAVESWANSRQTQSVRMNGRQRMLLSPLQWSGG